MYDGRFETLDEVIEHYNRGGDATENQDARIKPLRLTAQETRPQNFSAGAARCPLPKLDNP